MNSPKGLFYAIISSSTFGLVPLFAIPALQAGIPLNSVVFYRFLFSSILLGIILCIRKTNFKISGKQAFIIFGLAFLYAATSLLLTKSYLYIPSGYYPTLPLSCTRNLTDGHFFQRQSFRLHHHCNNNGYRRCLLIKRKRRRYT